MEWFVLIPNIHKVVISNVCWVRVTVRSRCLSCLIPLILLWFTDYTWWVDTPQKLQEHLVLLVCSRILQTTLATCYPSSSGIGLLRLTFIYLFLSVSDLLYFSDSFWLCRILTSSYQLFLLVLLVENRVVVIVVGFPRLSFRHAAS